MSVLNEEEKRVLQAWTRSGSVIAAAAECRMTVPQVSEVLRRISKKAPEIIEESEEE